MTPDAEELLRVGRESFKPSDADRARVFESLSAQIGDVGLVGGLSTTAAKSAWLPLSATVVGLGLLGGGLYLAFSPQPSAPPTMPVVPAVKAAQPAPVDPPVVEPKLDAPAEEPKLPAPRTTGGNVSTGRVDHLAEEVAILSRAGADLHSGRAASALKALDEHQRKFPGGALSQERSAARVQALCAVGRMKEAEAELKRLSRMSPRSPHEARARKACGIGSDGKN
jgi:hypothetical protein